ncbi:MAG: transporter associated domain-containing protein, partial [Candidatus Hydrogenedentes bacterium]|nr:transporter associated domain-containing protein [Candidatus Hydrogenedentota bacterium]
ETVAGFVMHRSEKVLEPGDELESDGVRFSLIECEGKRVSRLRVQVLPVAAAESKAHAPDGSAQ